MAISEIKKMTLLAEKHHLNEVLLSLQSSQAVELIPTPSDIQNQLTTDYYEAEELETLDETNEMFKAQSRKNEVSHLTNLLEDIRYHIEFVDDILPDKGFFAKLNEERKSLSLYELEDYMKDVDVTALIKEAEEFEKEFNALTKERERLRKERDFLERWHFLDFNPRVTEDFEITRAYVGAIEAERVNDLREALTHFDEIYIEQIHYSDIESIYLIITSELQARDVEQTLIRNRFERLNYSYDQLPSEELKRNKEELKNISQKLNIADQKTDKLDQLLKDLKIAEEYVYDKREREKARQDVLISEHLFVLTGWIEESMLDQQIKTLENLVGEETLYHYVEDVKESEIDDVPVKLKNTEATGAFENIVEMYGLPKYDGLDPSGFVQPFMILFFGMMTGDAGYGLLVLVLILLAMKFLNLSTGMKKNLKFFGQLMVGTTLVGLAYGSFFGFQLPFSLIDLNAQLVESLGISIAIGIVHLIIGLFLKTVQTNRKGNYAQSYTDGYSWILILAGVSILGINLIASGAGIWNTVGLGLIIINLIGIVLVTTLSAENKAAGLGQGLFGLMDVTSYIGDVLSYTRLTALGVAGVNIGMAFNLIVGMLPVWARFTIGLLIFAGLHLFYLFISFISAYVHSLRLNFVEFFGKFHTTGGKEFAPISMLEKNFVIKNETVQEQ